jgi:alpha-N-arabinofuranosidase
VDQDDFAALCWNTLGTPAADSFSISGGALTLRSPLAWLVPDDLPRTPAPNGCPGFYGRRQQHMCFRAEVTLAVPETGEAGVMLLQNGFNHLRVGVQRTAEGVVVRAVSSEKCGRPDYLNPREYPRHVDVLWQGAPEGNALRLGVAARGQEHCLLVNGECVARADGSFLGSETAGGFIGAYVGCYVSGAGAQAVFTDFRYTGEEDAHE